MGNLAIIPARGGSKRIPRKNIKPFMGKPIIAYSIETALKSDLFEEVMVSTDDEEIAAVARQYGAVVPFMRSSGTANDYATTNHLACIDIRNGELSRDEGMKIALKYDGKRPASLDLFLKVLGISEDDFIEIVKGNEVSDWGFDLSKIETGQPLHDMDKWNTII